MASGVQGRIDLNVPGGGTSFSTLGMVLVDGNTDERRDCGWMKRMLTEPTSIFYFKWNCDARTCDIDCNEIWSGGLLRP
jgi:hypothetical protein